MRCNVLTVPNPILCGLLSCCLCSLRFFLWLQVNTALTLAKQHGIASIWRGLGPTAIREAIYVSGYLGIAPVVTTRLVGGVAEKTE